MVSTGKWTKHRLLLQEERLKKYLPETKLYSEETLQEFLQKDGEAMIKPSKGSLGRRIYKITKIDEDKYEIHGGKEKVIVTGFKEAYNKILSQVSKKKNIIQKVIPLAKKDGQPFDVRVMVQKRKNTSDWQITGMAAKVASRGFFITNAAREVLPLEMAIKRSTIKPLFMRTKRILYELKYMSLLVAKALEEHYPDCTELGIDVGIDDDGKLWFIEVNVRPMISIFKILQDKSMYEEIQRIREENRT